MSADNTPNNRSTICVEKLHEAHPKIRAGDWRSPLVARLTDERPYKDGGAEISASYRSKGSSDISSTVQLSWKDLSDDYEQCINTYQAPIITEFAALAVACILCEIRAKIEITEVTRRGEKVDYWLGDRELLLEVSGTKSGDLAKLCDAKAEDQLEANPFRKDGYVCVARFEEPEARLWYYPFPGSRTE